MFARNQFFRTLLVFLSTALFIWWLAAHRFVPILDEGIYLDGAARIAKGQVPYRDFFVLTGPGTFWLHAALFRLLGDSLSNAHIPLVLDISLLTALIYWLTCQLARPAVAVFVTLCFLVFGTADQHIVAVNHRWDSSALGFLAIAFVFSLARRPNAWLAAAAGACAAASAWFTPSMGLLVVFLAAWLLFGKDPRPTLRQFIAGAAAVSVACAVALASTGALVPFFRHMLWTAANYSQANRVPYGAIKGGYSSLFGGANGVELLVRALVLAAIAIPAMLPPLNIAGFALAVKRGIEEFRSLLLLLLSMLVLVATNYPRWDIGHLLYAAPAGLVLFGWLADRLIPRNAQRFLALMPILLMAAFAYCTVTTRIALVRQSSRGGDITAAPQDLAFVRALEQTIPAGDTLFVFPYMPVIYHFTRTQNPTRYCFLQPGMMTAADEQAALSDLRARPPHWVVYSDISPGAYLSIFPNSDPARLRMPRIEDFISHNYEAVAAHRHSRIIYQILRIREDASAAQPDSSRPVSSIPPRA